MRKRSVQLIVPLAALWFCVPSLAQQVPLARMAYAVRVDSPPKLNGSLNDPLWLTAKAITDFRQREPDEGEPATERAEVRILYTKRSVYFGISCFESEGQHVTSSELRRDVSQDFDDYFEIVIDSRHDRRNAYVFEINPLGTQRDGLITEEQGGGDTDFDPGWDGVWVSSAQRTRSGWTATVEIPFSTLNFISSKDVVWGLNFKRFIRWKNEEDLWSGWRRAFGVTKVSQAGVLQGITDISSGRLLIIKPYLLGGFRHLPPAAAGSGLEPGTSIQHTGGVDAKIGLRSNLVANLTVNTDFADADVDIVQFNLTPYKLFFPEKRQFF
ncbi:MAG TPA: carbohydrate binding family 9 domain-containing protein [Terriglobales bacterium]|nr:carbohydrate binding family 9 domain-containing protein [Terriglobales bacterium]